MAGCSTCLHRNVHPNVCEDCLGGTHYKPRIKTNADRIRSMTDEELAGFIAIQRGKYCAYKDPTEEEYESALEWLKMEYANDIPMVLKLRRR